MKFAWLALLISVESLAACKEATSDPSDGRSLEKRSAAHEEPRKESVAPTRCNSAVADPGAAVDLAESARRAAGFLDMGEVESEKPMMTLGFFLSPMVPSQWPASSCAVSFYVYKVGYYADNSVYHLRYPVAARINVRLDTGAVDVVRLTNGPGHGGLIPEAGGRLRPDQQQWIFDAVATATVPEAPTELAFYHEWLAAEEFVTAALYAWHREFFDFVVGDDAEIIREAKANVDQQPGQDR